MSNSKEDQYKVTIFDRITPVGVLRQAIKFSDSFEDSDKLDAVHVMAITKKRRVFCMNQRVSTKTKIRKNNYISATYGTTNKEDIT